MTSELAACLSGSKATRHSAACPAGVTHWQSPNYFAWFPANTSLPGVLAEMLAAALNMVGFNWESGPVSTELDMVSCRRPVLHTVQALFGLVGKVLAGKALAATSEVVGAVYSNWCWALCSCSGVGQCGRTLVFAWGAVCRSSWTGW